MSSGDVLGERPAGETELVVELDRGGECEEAASDAGSEAVQGSGAVAFKGEDVLGGPVDRFDPLTDWREMGAGWLLVGAAGLRGDLRGGPECRGARRRFCCGRGRGGSLVPALRSDDGRVERGELGLELLAAEVLVADQGQELAGLAAAARDQLQADFFLVDLRGGQRDRARGAVDREQRVQPEAVEEAAVAGAVAVVGGVAERVSQGCPRRV